MRICAYYSAFRSRCVKEETIQRLWFVGLGVSEPELVSQALHLLSIWLLLHLFSLPIYDLKNGVNSNILYCFSEAA